MGKANKVVGVVLPESITIFIQSEIDAGEFTSSSEWVRVACREFYEKRKRDRLGGGVLTDLGCFAKKICRSGFINTVPAIHNRTQRYNHPSKEVWGFCVWVSIISPLCSLQTSPSEFSEKVDGADAPKMFTESQWQ